MTQAALDMHDQEGGSVRSVLRALASQWPLLIGFLVMAALTLRALALQSWGSEIGAHGPIVLATGAWLLSRCWPDMTRRASAPRAGLLALLLAGALALYIFGRAYDFLFLEAAGLYLTGIAIVYHLVGGDGLRVAMFPLLYLGFVIPLPGWVMDQLTGPLRELVSYAATGILRALDYPIMRQGVALFIAQYQLLVEDACAGMNSVVGLAAITLFYIYVMDRARARYAPLLLLMVIPVALLVNLIRVMALILITYYLGDGVAQGFMHMTTGMVLFAAALVIMFLLDMVFRLVFRGRVSSANAARRAKRRSAT